eukprot:8978918-Pyramimonas_sp.AAC.1
MTVGVMLEGSAPEHSIHLTDFSPTYASRGRHVHSLDGMVLWPSLTMHFQFVGSNGCVNGAGGGRLRPAGPLLSVLSRAAS